MFPMPVIHGAQGSRTLLQVIQQTGLTSGLKLCLDAGDANSYDPAVQTDKWLDTSGQSSDFYRGSGTGSDAQDPTFNGSAGGKSASENFSFDGGDDLTLVATNPSWVNALHQDSALLTAICWINAANFSSLQGLWGTRAGSNANIGAVMFVDTSGLMTYAVGNGSGTAAKSVNAITAAISVGAWCFAALSVNEAAGAGGSFFYAGATGAETFDGTYASPSASAASFQLQIGSRGNANGAIRNGGKLGMLAMWQGVALTADQLDMVFQRTRKRYGI